VGVGDDFRACRWFLRRAPWRGAECPGGRLDRNAAGVSPPLGRGGWGRHRLGWRSRPRAVILMAMRDRLRLARSAGRFCSSSASKIVCASLRGCGQGKPGTGHGRQGVRPGVAARPARGDQGPARVAHQAEPGEKPQARSEYRIFLSAERSPVLAPGQAQQPICLVTPARPARRNRHDSHDRRR
jgi:hypothetical protein